MAKTKDPSDGDSEKLQIAVLTFFMTAGGFLLLTLVFALWYNPREEARMKAAEQTYERLTKLLQQEDMVRLRHQDRLNKEAGSEQGLRDLITQNLSTFGLQYREFRPLKRSEKKGGVVEVTQQITLEPASMTPILQFVATVEEARKSVRVAQLDLTRNKRVAEDEDSWTGQVMFVDYETSGGGTQ